MENVSDENIDKLKLEQVCRTCLINYGNFFDLCHIFDHITLAQMIQDITNLQVNSLDGYTQSVCFKCVKDVRRAHKFRRKCLESHCTLMKLETNPKTESFNELIAFNCTKDEPLEITNIKEESDDDCNLAKYLKTELNEGNDQPCKPDSPVAENNYDDGDSESDELVSDECVKSDKKDNKNLNTIFDCPLCHGLFTSYNIFNKHLHKFHADKIKDVNLTEQREPLGYIIKETSKRKQIKLVYKCAMNDFIGNTLVELKTHIHEHMGEKPVTCTECDFRTTAIGLLKKHKLQKHTEEKKFSCSECDYSCKSQNALKSHFAIHTSDKNFKCPVCPMTFKRGSDLSTHKKVKHEQRKCHVCNICQKAFFHSTSLKEHIFVHTGERPHVCHYCGKTFSQRNNLNTHVTLKHLPLNEIYKCDICKYTTKQKYQLTAHIKTHFAEKNFQCHHCSYKTKRNSTLKAHMMRHFDVEKRFSCDICDYKCMTIYQLKIHKRDHTGERPFPCSICNYSGKSNHALLRHSQTHNTELKFICHNCPYRTNTRELLLKHLRKKCVVKPRGRRPSQPAIVLEMQGGLIDEKIKQNIEEPININTL